MNFLGFHLFVVALHLSVEANLLTLIMKTEKKFKERTDTRSVDALEPQNDQRIRFRVNTNLHGYSSGILEVYKAGKWGIVCDDDWDEQDADVACRELGFPLGAKRPLYKGPPNQVNWNSLSFVVNNIECQGNEGSLLSCPYSTNTECVTSKSVSVTCVMQDKTDHSSITTNRKTALGFIKRRVKRELYEECREGCAIEELMKGYANRESSYKYMTAFKCRGLYCPKGCVATNNDFSHSDRLRVACVDMQIVLVNGDAPNKGRVEIIRNGVRGTVCDDEWDDNDATVICRMIGYNKGGTAVAETIFGAGSGDILLDDVQCDGTESSIENCRHAGWRVNNCAHWEDAGVQCWLEIQTSLWTSTYSPVVHIVLVNGSARTAGRVEIIRNGVRGTVCDDEWDDNDATVICRMLGYNKGGIAVAGVIYGEGSGNILLDDVQCDGTENSIAECRHAGWKVHNCQHSEDAAVRCWLDSQISLWTSTFSPDIHIELVNCNAANKGRVEIIRNGVRGTVCDDEWDDNDATVICRMLGYNKGGTAVAGAKYGQGSGHILLDKVQCDGTESSINNCRHAGWRVNDCKHSQDAGVRCLLESRTSLWNSTFSPDIQIELLNGGAPERGRVEIIRNGVRGTVCDDRWDDNDATVICRMLGYYKGGIAVARGIYGKGSGNILLDDVQCDGTENFLQNCRHAGWLVHNCQHSQDAGVRCRLKSQKSLWASTFSPDIQIVLVNGGAPDRGRVVIIRNGVRGTVCDDGWDDNDATVICRMLGYNKGTAVTAVSQTFYGAGSGDILLDDVWCDGAERSIEDCHHVGWRVHDCQHSEDAGVRCQTIRPSIYETFLWTFSPTCGVRPLQKRKREKIGALVRSYIDHPANVIGGKYSEYGRYPWQVGVQNISSNTHHWCGGTILNKQWVLSAAHCFFEWKNKPEITLRTGDHVNTQIDRYEQEFDVEAVYMHENYNPDTYDYDVALLKISSDEGIRFNDYVQPACLPDVDTPYKPGQPCHISGWGAHKDEDDDDDEVDESVLKEAMVPIINDTNCQSLYNGSITSRMFCAGFEKGGTDSCKGDSGGPLVCKIDGRYTVLGAVSWGEGCGKPGYPGVYTHIRNLLPWIIDKLKKYNK